MSLLVTGSIGIDTVETPYGKRDDVLGGSAIYFSYAASFFTPVRLVGVVGDDAPPDAFDVFHGRDVDTSGLEVRKGSKTFRWHGSFVKDMNEAVTVEVDLNVLAERAPAIPAKFVDSKYVFLANTHPALQQQMLASMSAPKLVVADTMNLWITTERVELLKLLERIDGLVLNDGEARLLTEKKNLIDAGRAVLGMGPKFVVIKKGEHGSLLFTADEVFTPARLPGRQGRRPDRRRRQLRRRHDGATCPPRARSARRRSSGPWRSAPWSPPTRSATSPWPACSRPPARRSTAGSRRSRRR